MKLLNAKDIYLNFKSDKVRNSNVIVDLLKELQGSDVKKLRKAVAVIHKIFCQLIKEKDVTCSSETNGTAQTAKEKYDEWLYERYVEVHCQLLDLAVDEEKPLSLREVCFIAVLKLLQKEAIYPVTEEKINKIKFPLTRLKDLYTRLLLCGKNCNPLIGKLKESLTCPDFLYASIKVTSTIVCEIQGDKLPQFYVENLVSFLELVNIPVEKAKLLDKPKLFCSEKSGEGSEVDFYFPAKEGKKTFNKIWEQMLKMKLTPDTYKRCLIIIPEKVMKHLKNPVLLTDFFMDAYNLGGVMSILAMHGVYILITKYNLDYPDFYQKVYTLLNTSVLHCKHKNFFVLCDKFFTSPYLPEYIVAAFIKRCSRLLLTAPSSCLILLLKFIVNLLIRFPSLRKLIDNPNASCVTEDPFIEDEENLQRCRASESSLWEVAMLHQHPLCGVSKAANFITKNLPDLEFDLSRFVNSSYEELYSKASRIKMPRVATTFYKPEGLFRYSDDQMSPTWDIM